MTWAELQIQINEEAFEAVSHILYEAGANGLVVENDNKKYKQASFSMKPSIKSSFSGTCMIKVYFPNDHKLANKMNQIKKSIAQLENFDIHPGEVKLSVKNLKNENWETSWQKYYKPIDITDKMKIIPVWEKETNDEQNKKLIYLDPGMAFGTGSHPTTKLSIQALEDHLTEQSTMIDVGCGSGILSIAACLLGAKKVLAIDHDELAIKSTKFNCSLNHCADQVEVLKNNLLKDLNIQADFIVANILMNVILELIEEVWYHLKEDGLFIISGITEEQKCKVTTVLEKNNFAVKKIQKKDHWLCMIAEKKII